MSHLKLVSRVVVAAALEGEAAAAVALEEEAAAVALERAAGLVVAAVRRSLHRLPPVHPA
ncbi:MULTISPECIES: hypothetical protein [Mycobacterium]|uniref:hypothetical protein n=1 Tax=Mycobacterium TaxID=1763 RepID=UPI0027417BFF|nr:MULTISPECIES: hypothetical protein [unclassified Mycobacterium]